MEKTTVYLPVELKTALRRVALRRGVSEAEIIRESLRQAVAGEDRPRPRSGLISSDVTIARSVDEALRGFGER
jgi:plasmid stability protein